MEAARRPSQPALGTPAPSAAKLVVEKFADDQISCLRFVGTIDEGFEGKQLGQSVTGDTLLIDLGGVKKISSFGIREWVDFVSAAVKQVRTMILIECTPKVVDQLNMVANFVAGGQVFSVYAPFRCDYCDSEHRVLLQVDKDHEAIKAGKLAERPCPACKEAMYFDEDGATFFSYLRGQPRFDLAPEVAGFLASKLDYAVDELNRKLRVDKVIEDRTTYLRLTGDLDRGFPRDKLAEGLEGTVVVDLAAIGRIEPAGAAAWRGFVGLVTPVIDQLYLASVPPAFLDKLCGTDDLGARTQVLTLTLPYTCARCGTTSGQLIDVERHHAVLKFATAPELHCTTCKHALACVAGEALMTRLPGLPRPTASGVVVRQLATLRARSLQTQRDKQLATNPGFAAAAPAATPQRGRWGAILAALVAVVLAAAGYLVYQRLTAVHAPASARGTVTARSAAARPAWFTTDTEATATCRDAAGGLSCVGVSSLAGRQDDAEQEAADAAYDAVANALAVRASSAAWKAAVVPLYQASRDAKLAAFDRDPSSTTARRDVREARAAVSRMLRASGGGAVPPTPTGRYWEAYTASAGTRYLAFAELKVGATELAALTEGYGHPATALGATVVGLFPLVGWRHPRLDHGAIVIGLEPGPLQALGLADGYVILTVDGREVVDADAFARFSDEVHARLVERGGPLRLKVQADDGAPREFTMTIAAPQTPPSTPPPTTNGRPPSATGSGGVNVWDRYNGKGSGRDDPTQ